MKKNPVGTLIVLVAAVISFLGLVLPFYSVDFLGQKMSVSLMSIDGEIQVIAIVWAAFIVLALLFALIGKKVPVLIFALLGAIGLFLSYTLNNSELEEYGAIGSLVEKGLGNTLTLVGAICLLVSGIIYVITTKSNKA